jgi:hypothetical protein
MTEEQGSQKEEIAQLQDAEDKSPCGGQILGRFAKDQAVFDLALTRAVLYMESSRVLRALFTGSEPFSPGHFPVRLRPAAATRATAMKLSWQAVLVIVFAINLFVAGMGQLRSELQASEDSERQAGVPIDCRYRFPHDGMMAAAPNPR